MLEFYPMPTNLNPVGGSLYSLQQNHGGARFLDNPNPNSNPNSSSLHLSSSNNSNLPSSISGNNSPPGTASLTGHQQQQQQQHQQHPHQQHQQHQQQHAASTTPVPINSCPTPTGHSPLSSSNNNNNNNNNSSSSSSNLNSACNTLTAAAVAAAAAGVAAPSATATSVATSQLGGAVAAAIAAAAAAAAATTAATSSAPAATGNGNGNGNANGAAASAAAASKLSADCSGRTEVGHIKCEKNFELCEGCGQKIHDRFLMNVGEANWHEQCLACCYCGMQLHHTCYVRNSKLYCKMDYDRLFGVKCSSCCHAILPQELVMRPIPNFVFHLPCFVCYACRLPLQKGEQFLLRDGQLFCYRHDLEKEMFLAAAAAQHCGFVGLDEEDLLRPRDGRRGPKRPRTILTSQQRKQFKASFDQSPKPCRKVREALAKDTGLSVRVVQVWFQNQRAKMKKIQRKAKQNGGSGGGSGSGRGTGGNSSATDDKDTNEKEEKCVKQELGGDSSGYLGGLDSTFASQPLNPNLPFSPDDYPANSNDSFCSSDLSLDGSNFDQLDDDADSLSLNNLELQSTSSSGNQHSHSHSHSNPHDMLANLNNSLINPIDKLYLMQNSYFSSEH
ncbi:LIM homeobox transcription factor 1-alpha isoform X1 [Drosophila subpulchrella]|uniref:LIM homeobox transcription factor 1-alpha isoform X1 n=1 Tax=Drosophila subpulchrella TaxID=1486046 RepID=UPI0018A14647|nr:LIM homeobox transcription factor 1-alpha isoform X1 [Drosophila subpulchrella]